MDSHSELSCPGSPATAQGELQPWPQGCLALPVQGSASDQLNHSRTPPLSFLCRIQHPFIAPQPNPTPGNQLCPGSLPENHGSSFDPEDLSSVLRPPGIAFSPRPPPLALPLSIII